MATILAGIFEGVEILRTHQTLHGVGELDLAAGARCLGGEQIEHLRLQNVAAGDLEARGRLIDRRCGV